MTNNVEIRIDDLEQRSHDLGCRMLQMCIKAGKGHVSSSLSCLDMFVALYHGGILRVDPTEPKWEDRDRLILSKGQASPALYTTLADFGFFPLDWLETFTQENGKFAVHLQHDVPGVEITAGSLGQGYGTAAGIALAAKMNRKLFMVYAILGDGECYEGSIWETAMFASHNRLNNLVTIIDRNYLCVTDFTEDLVALEPLDEKWRAFGFNVIRINGHSMKELLRTFQPLRNRNNTKPTVIIADTVKGHSIPSMCFCPLWHGRAPQGSDAEKFTNEIQKKRGFCYE